MSSGGKSLVPLGGLTSIADVSFPVAVSGGSATSSALSGGKIGQSSGIRGIEGKSDGNAEMRESGELTLGGGGGGGEEAEAEAEAADRDGGRGAEERGEGLEGEGEGEAWAEEEVVEGRERGHSFCLGFLKC